MNQIDISGIQAGLAGAVLAGFAHHGACEVDKAGLPKISKPVKSIQPTASPKISKKMP